MKVGSRRALIVMMWALVGPSVIADQLPESTPPRLTLLDAGSGARQVLRYGAKKGDTFSKRFTMRMNLTSSVNDVSTPLSPLPTMAVGIELRVVDVGADGDLSVDFGYSDVNAIQDASVSEAAVAALQKGLSAINGVHGRMVMTNRGSTRAFSLDVLPGINPTVAQQLAGLNRSFGDAAAVLPEEPIGLGARWRVEEQRNLNGLLVTYARTYTLTAVSGSVATIAVDVTQSANDQDMTLADLPRGFTAHLDSMTGWGSGRIAIAAGELMSRQSEMSVSSETRMTVAGLGPTQKVRQTLATTIALSDAGPQARR